MEIFLVSFKVWGHNGCFPNPVIYENSPMDKPPAYFTSYGTEKATKIHEKQKQK